MRAIILKEFGSVANLVESEVAKPEIATGEILIATKAISINPVDVKTRAGKGQAGRLKELSPLILGWDVAGTVEESKSPLFNKGDDVFGMVNFPGHGQAYAEYVAAPADQLAIKPRSLPFEEAAAATLAALTAWQALVSHARVEKGQRVLVHAAAGGVGHFAVQLAKHLGAYVIGTSSLENKDFVLGLGADEHIDYQHTNLEDQTHDIDLVLDTIGGDNIDKSLLVIKKGGTIISIPSGSNATVTEKAKAMGINGYGIMVKSSGTDMQQLALLLADQTIKAHVSKVYPFEQLAQAHLQIETGKTKGKIVVVL